MEFIKNVFENSYEIIFIKIQNIEQINLEETLKYFKHFKHDQVFNLEKKIDLFLIKLIKKNYDLLELYKNLNEIIKKQLTLSFNLHFFYFKININNLIINENRIIYKNEETSIFNWEYNNLKEFLLKNKEFLNLFEIIKKYALMNNNWIKKNEEKVILIKNFKSLNIDFIKLFNLINVFGFIENIYYNYYNCSILIKYLKKIEVNRIMNDKNLLKYQNKTINIENICEYSKKLKINFFKEIKINSKLNRFNKNFIIKYNKPNNVIIICNLGINVSIFRIYNILKKYAEPLLMKFISKIKNETKMCLVKFNTIFESINIITNLHNTNIENMKLKISFSFNQF